MVFNAVSSIVSTSQDGAVTVPYTCTTMYMQGLHLSYHNIHVHMKESETLTWYNTHILVQSIFMKDKVNFKQIDIVL